MRIDEVRGLVVAEVVGTIDVKSTLAVVGQARDAAAASGFPILYDMRGAVPGDMSSGALYWLPREVPQLQGASARRTRAALLHEPQYAAMAQYWEDTFRNAGLAVRAFTVEDDAVDWLGGPRPVG